MDRACSVKRLAQVVHGVGPSVSSVRGNINPSRTIEFHASRKEGNRGQADKAVAIETQILLIHSLIHLLGY
jgi:hypothetical protein